MKVTFIHHSCFCVELEDKVFIFDYFKGNRIPGFEFKGKKLSDFEFKGKIPEFSKEQSIYVFSSHQHEDHFDMEVLRWVEKYSNIKYIFSKDIRLGDNYLIRNGIDPAIKERISFLKANASLSLDGIEIETLVSTDAGVAFLVTYAGKTIYHAGDLHWWHWDGQEEIINEYQEKTYKNQINKLSKRKLDLAFVVIDQRLETALFWGIDYFMKHVDAAYVIPMHLWQNYDLIAQYKALPETQAFAGRILDVEEENQVFEIR